MRIEPYRPEHLQRIKLQATQQWCRPMLSDEFLLELQELDGYTAFVGDEPVACAGTMHAWEGRHMAWSFISEKAGPHMLGITRAVMRYLELKRFRRVEAYVDPDFEAGHRWIKRLGFKREGLLEAFLPDGRSQVLYSRVTHG